MAFAGISYTWTGTWNSKANPVEGKHQLFEFLTCDMHAVVAPVHP